MCNYVINIQQASYLTTLLRSRAKIFTRNGGKGRFKAVMQKYSQELAGNPLFREVVQKYSCPATHRGRLPVKKYPPGGAEILILK